MHAPNGSKCGVEVQLKGTVRLKMHIFLLPVVLFVSLHSLCELARVDI